MPPDRPLAAIGIVQIGYVCLAGTPPVGSGTQLTVSCYCTATNTCKLRFCNSGSVANSINTGIYRLRTFGQ
jgi:hypothetical protein